MGSGGDAAALAGDSDAFAAHVATTVLARVEAGRLPRSAWETEFPPPVDDAQGTPRHAFYVTDLAGLRVELRRSDITDRVYGYSLRLYAGPGRDVLVGLLRSDQPDSVVGRLVTTVAGVIEHDATGLRRAALGELDTL